MLLSSCKSSPDPAKPGNNDTGSGLTYLALGDSYTIGESVSKEDRWPMQLAAALRENGVAVQEPYFIARTGWTTKDLLDGTQNYHPDKPYDVVSLLIGVNNQYQGRSIEEYRSQFHDLLVRSIGYAGGNAEKVFVLSIPDWGVTPFGESVRKRTAKEIDNFNKVAKEECDKEKILFINITDISRTALNDVSMVASDNLHFSAKMYRLWVNETIPAIKPKI
ncbi:SGNH/GDSL hydrolase family protein [Dyadobacter luticola]|uniref:SGNH/GDSL hydrolase family protein n=2 Tax=Dyadobacter luticola TaxID=1979387 RepID=A0A5R9L664_9BACT|nr:SGNH/GDSL hydrolase family protein [Dyadobacter luticola]